MTEPQLAHKYDAATIKQTLDDIVVSVAGESYKESKTSLIVTSVIGVVSIALACYGQFVVPFPQKTSLLVVIVAINLLLTAAIQLYTWSIGSSTLFESVATKLRPTPIVIASQMERFSINYTFSAYFKKSPSQKQTWSKSAAQWIREDGSVDRSSFELVVRMTLQQLEGSRREAKN